MKGWLPTTLKAAFSRMGKASALKSLSCGRENDLRPYTDPMGLWT